MRVMEKFYLLDQTSPEGT